MNYLNYEDITFVITTFKSEKIIFDCLDSLDKRTKKIVIENSSNYNLKKQLETKYQNLKCYVMQENLGYGKGNNIGIQKSKTRYIFILNPDAKLLENTIADMFRTLKNINFSIAAPCEQYDINLKNFGKNEFLEKDYVRGFAMLIDKNVIQNVGYFDENIFLYMEEIDLCRRAKIAGKKIYLVNTQIIHESGFSHADRKDFEMEKSRNWHWMWSKFYYNHKHKGFIWAFFITFPNFFSAFFKMCFYFLIKREIKKEIYMMRFKGLLNSYLMKKSFYRPYKE